jgi:hypothetical protein
MEETGFKIERAAAAAGPFSQVSVVGANATSYEDSGLTAAMTYHYRVKATNAAGDSAYTAVASAMTMPDTPDQICAPSETRCIAGDIGKFQRCNASGSAWEDPATCSGLSLCSDRQCRVVCEMTSTPVNPTLCLFPNRDGVNDGEWRFWTDSRLASPANTGGGSKADAGGQAPVINSGETWPHAWRISAVDFTFAQFKLNQFSFPRSQRLAFRAKREGVISNGTSNFFVGAFNGAGALISNCTFGPVPFSYITTSCLNGAPLGGRMSYDGSFNTMLLSITGSGVPDFLDVNWIKLSIEP